MPKNKQFEVETIIDKAKVNGRVQYLIKWKGYDSDENSWETRMDLIDDGLKGEIDKYESTQPKTPGKKKTPVKKTPAKRSASASKRKTATKSPAKKATPRARSKSPAAVKRKKKEEAVEETESDETSESEESEEETSATIARRYSSSGLGDVQSYRTLKLPSDFALSWIFLFLTFVLVVIVMEIVGDSVTLDADSKVLFTYCTLVVRPIPSLLCLLSVYRNVPATDYANRVCAALLWISMLGIFETLPPSVYQKSNNFTSKQIELVCVAVWQMMMLLVVSIPSDAPKANPVSAVAIGTVLYLGATQVEGIKNHSNPHWITGLICMIVACSVASLVRSVARIGYGHESSMDFKSFPQWLDFGSVVCGMMIVVIELLETYEMLTIKDFDTFIIPDVGSHKVTVPKLWLTFMFLRMVAMFLMTISALLDSN